MDKVSPVDITTLQERVYQELRSALHQGRFVPGEVITIRALATALGTSPMPVREALQRLVAEKALVQSPNRNIRVAPLTAETFEEIMRIRMSIEGFAARRAAMRGNRALVDRLRASNERMRQAIRDGDDDTALDANRQFHFQVYEAAEAPQLLEIIRSLWLRSGPFLALTLRTLPGSNRMFETGIGIHDRLIDAIATRSPETAGFMLALDIRAAARWSRRHFRFNEPVDAAEVAARSAAAGGKQGSPIGLEVAAYAD